MNELPIEDNLQKAVIDRVPQTQGRGRNHARNAIHSLEMAWRIRQIDPEIAAFRGIHAEEEAAAALFHALKLKRYRGAEKLQWRTHIHKAALQPYFDVVVNALRGTKLPAKFEADWSPDRPGHGFRLRITLDTGDDSEQHYVVYEPLSFNSSVGGAPDDFRQDFEALVTQASADSILDFIQRQSNERNRALYATDRGIPKFVGNIDEAILVRRDRTLRVLLIFVIVVLERDRQTFVRQALNGFLGLLGLMPESVPDEDEM